MATGGWFSVAPDSQESANRKRSCATVGLALTALAEGRRNRRPRVSMRRLPLDRQLPVFAADLRDLRGGGFRFFVCGRWWNRLFRLARSLSHIVFTSPRIRPCSDLSVAKSLKGNQSSRGLSASISKQARTRGSKANARQAPRAGGAVSDFPQFGDAGRNRWRKKTGIEYGITLHFGRSSEKLLSVTGFTISIPTPFYRAPVGEGRSGRR